MAKITGEELEAAKAAFNKHDAKRDGELEIEQAREAFASLSIKITGHELRERADASGSDNKIKLTLFLEILSEMKEKDPALQFLKTKVLSQPERVETVAGHVGDTKHTIRSEEKVAFAEWINSCLGKDAFLRTKNYLPISPQGNQLYDKCMDGILICKLINYSVPETVDERALNMEKLNDYRMIENNNLVLNSALAIGCNVVNIGAVDLLKKKEHLMLGLLWQIIRIGLLANINLEFCPGIMCLLQSGETLDDLRKLSPEDILMRWVNYHLDQAGCSRRLKNFTNDIKDSEIYCHLLTQICPGDRKINALAALKDPNHVNRATHMLGEAEKIEARAFVRPTDVANGNYKLNLAFVANLFNLYPALEPPQEELHIEETREEKTYRNWMNSLGVKPRVNYIYSDLTNGLVIFQILSVVGGPPGFTGSNWCVFHGGRSRKPISCEKLLQLIEAIYPGSVDKSRIKVEFKARTAHLDKVANCNYVVELCKKVGISVVNVGGKDLTDGTKNMTLAIVWQLMRAYTMMILKVCAGTGNQFGEKEIVEWANNKLAKIGKKSKITGFQDPAISDGMIIMELIDGIQPGIVNFDAVKKTDDPAEKTKNAKYAISIARKLGAKVYALPEDIVEVKPKPLLTVFACLMARDLKPDYKPPSLRELLPE